MRAPLPHNEPVRLAALHDYEVLDTPAEEDFDRIVHLVRAICEVPICLISLVETDRQWFKARDGLDLEQTPIDQAICAHAIAQDGYLEIADTRADERTRDNPLCAGEDGIRFYAGALLRTREGLPIGTLCVLDRRPRSLTPVQRETLDVLAEQVVRQLDLRQALKRQDVLRREIDHRVKNSLMSIAGLVRLEAERAEVPETSEILRDVERRIQLVAMLHEALHRTSVVEKVDMAPFLEKIEAYFRETSPPNVSVEIRSDALVFASEQAAAIAYIVNECVTNSLKHAFPDGREGRVDIRLAAAGNGIVLECRDDGVGYAPAAGEPASGLGLRIIRASARQLKGKLRWLRDAEGFGIHLAWPGVEAA